MALSKLTPLRLGALTFLLAVAAFYVLLAALGCENSCDGVHAFVADLWVPLVLATVVSLIATAVSGVRRLRSRSARR